MPELGHNDGQTNCYLQGGPAILWPVIALSLLLLLPAASPAQLIDTLALRAHTRFLSHDSLMGRGTGTRGEQIAARYIESQLRILGVQPAGTGSYRQPVPLRQASIDSARIVLRGGADSTVFANPDFLINTGGERALQGFAGPTLLVGTAEHARSLNDGAISGHVLVLLGTLGADAETLVPRWLNAGVQGVILLIPDSAQFQLFERSRGETRYFIAAPVDEPIWQSALPMIIGGPALARGLIADVGSVLTSVARNAAFPPVRLRKDLRLTLKTTLHTVSAQNIMGVIPGRDARLRDQYVVYTAHYDHLGISTPDARGDSIYNGFSDNAAGVAMLLAIAQEMMRAPPARSVAFLFFTGEERGLLGSTYYASSPLIPLDRTTAVINLDAGAPPAPPVEWRLAGGAGNRLGPLAQQIASQHGWRVDLGAASPNSDYWPFHKRAVPAVFIIPGSRWEGLSSAERDALRARWDRYHRADDEWSEHFPFSGLQRYALFALELGRLAAAAPD
ncbi:MAG: M28 family peptidase [Longimicrobiales bacterium]